eukprot:gene9906-13326_t
MNHKLTDCYPWSYESDLTSQFILSLDQTCCYGEFTLVYLLFKLLAIPPHGLEKINMKSSQVVLICTNHDRNHYDLLMRKNNLDLRKLEQSGKLLLIFLTPTIEVNDRIIQEEELNKYISWSQLENLFHFDNTDGNNSDTIFNLHNTESISILIDDIEALETVAPTTMLARNFMSNIISSMHKGDNIDVSKNSGGVLSHIHCVAAYGRHPLEFVSEFTSFASNHNNSTKYWKPSIANGNRPTTSINSVDTNSIPFTINVCPLDEQDEPEPVLTEYLRYRSDITVVIGSLQTGHSSDIHGIIRVTGKYNISNTKLAHNELNVVEQIYHYKAMDSYITCSVVGNLK